MNELRYFKMRNTGEDVIAELDYENNEIIQISNPILFYLMTDYSTGRQVFALKEWINPLIADKKSYTINLSDILLMSDVTDFFKREYKEFISASQSPSEKSTTQTGNNVIQFSNINDKIH